MFRGSWMGATNGDEFKGSNAHALIIMGAVSQREMQQGIVTGLQHCRWHSTFQPHLDPQLIDARHILIRIG